MAWYILDYRERERERERIGRRIIPCEQDTMNAQRCDRDTAALNSEVNVDEARNENLVTALEVTHDAAFGRASETTHTRGEAEAEKSSRISNDIGIDDSREALRRALTRTAGGTPGARSREP